MIIQLIVSYLTAGPLTGGCILLYYYGKVYLKKFICKYIPVNHRPMWVYRFNTSKSLSVWVFATVVSIPIINLIVLGLMLYGDVEKYLRRKGYIT